MDGEKPAAHAGNRRQAAARDKQEKPEESVMDAIVTNLEESVLDVSSPRLPKDVQNRIGEQLRAAYNEIVEEPVPDHLRQLLERLKTKE